MLVGATRRVARVMHEKTVEDRKRDMAKIMVLCLERYFIGTPRVLIE